MNRFVRMSLLLLALGLSLGAGTSAAAEAEDARQLKLATLLRSELEGSENTEVIVSLVELPPDTGLAAHFHPGEEFVYVLEGSGNIYLKGEEAVALKAGDVFKVPFKQVHWADSGKDGFKALVFRVHEKGQPERVLVDQ